MFSSHFMSPIGLCDSPTHCFAFERYPALTKYAMMSKFLAFYMMMLSDVL